MSRYDIEPETGGTFAIYEQLPTRRQFIARYLHKKNAEKHVARLLEKWG